MPVRPNAFHQILRDVRAKLGPGRALAAGGQTPVAFPARTRLLLTGFPAILAVVAAAGLFVEGEWCAEVALVLAVAGGIGTWRLIGQCARTLAQVESERLRAETALRESEESLGAALGSIGDAVVATDAAGQVVLVNPAAEKLCGHTLSDALGQPFAELFELRGPESQARWQPPMDAWSDGDPVPALGRFLLVAKDGARRFVSVSASALRSPRGSLEGLIWVFHDVTEQQRAQAELQRIQGELREVIERSPDGIVVLAEDDRILFANHAFASSLGFDGTVELTGRAFTDLVHDKDRQALRVHLRACAEDSRTAEVRLVHRSGEPVTIEAAAVRRIGYGGQRAALLVARDVTEARKLQDRLARSDRLASMGMLAAGVAHEINNPLASMIGNLGYVQRSLEDLSTADLADVREAVLETQDGATRVKNIVQQLKSLSRGDEMLRAPTDVAAVVRAAVAIAKTEIRHRAQLDLTIAEVPPVLANEGQLGQVILNLLVNAAQAIPLGRANLNRIKVAVRHEGERDQVVVEVSDTGPGIPAEIRGRIFDPFFTTKPVGVGTGLGLSISHDIVGRMGGELSFETELGMGTTFRVALPATRDELPESAPRPQQDSERARVLVVDDDPLVGNALKRSLGERHEVLFLNSGQRALERILAGEHFDVILCDVIMPVMTGAEFHAAVSKAAPQQLPRIVFISGGTLGPAVEQVLGELPNPRLQKPWEPEALNALIAELVARGGRRASA